jgi:hypothetical protein
MGTRRIEDGVAKEYVWQNYPEVRTRIENFGKGMLHLGLKRQHAIGIYSVNRPEWVIHTYRDIFSENLYFIDHDRDCILQTSIYDCCTLRHIRCRSNGIHY